MCTNRRPLPPLKLVSRQIVLHCRVLTRISKAFILHLTCGYSLSCMHAASCPLEAVDILGAFQVMFGGQAPPRSCGALDESSGE